MFIKLLFRGSLCLILIPPVFRLFPIQKYPLCGQVGNGKTASGVGRPRDRNSPTPTGQMASRTEKVIKLGCTLFGNGGQRAGKPKVPTLMPPTSVSGPREMVTDDGIPCIVDTLVGGYGECH